MLNTNTESIQHTAKNKCAKNNANNLLVYQKAKILAIDVFTLFAKKKHLKSYEFVVNQLRRAIASIGANIVEGYGRMYAKSYRQFLSIARGSCYESCYWLEIALNTDLINNEEFESLNERVTEILKMTTTMMIKLEQRVKNIQQN